MTVIVWDGKTLAADKRACYDGMINTVTKIHRITGRGVLVGGSGDAAFVNAMIAWVRNGRVLDQFPAEQKSKDDWCSFLVIEQDGTISLYERSPYPVLYEQTLFAIGSGREYARAALHLGCTSAEAVGVACCLDSGCGNGIDTLTLES